MKETTMKLGDLADFLKDLDGSDPAMLDVSADDHPQARATMQEFEDGLFKLLEEHAPKLHADMGKIGSKRLDSELEKAPLHFHAVTSLIVSAGTAACLRHLMKVMRHDTPIGHQLTLPMTFLDAISRACGSLHDRYQAQTSQYLKKVLFEKEKPAEPKVEPTPAAKGEAGNIGTQAVE
jgi:hypothetical protein